MAAGLTRGGYGPISTFSVLNVLEYVSAPKTPIWTRLLAIEPRSGERVCIPGGKTRRRLALTRVASCPLEVSERFESSESRSSIPMSPTDPLRDAEILTADA